MKFCFKKLSSKKTSSLKNQVVKSMAPDVGFEPTTKRLTAAYSTAELIWNFAQTKRNFSVFFVKSQVK